MHSGILLAVEAEDVADAIHSVENFNEHNAQWSDWNSHGGRWSEMIPDGVLRYSDNPEVFMQVFEQFKGWTKKEFDRLVDDLGNINIRELALDPKYEFGGFKGEYATDEEKRQALDNSLARYRAGKLMQLLNGEFSNDSHFYDIDNYTMKDDYLLERIKENPERQFIVVWDYHH